MSNWNGFSDEELIKMNVNESSNFQHNSTEKNNIDNSSEKLEKENKDSESQQLEKNLLNKFNFDREIVIDDEVIAKKEKFLLEKFRNSQKQMEEMNEKKKTLLSKVVNQKFNQTKEEAAKLQKIRKELEQMDQTVLDDVNIIRDHIEVASRSFLATQKKYEALEKEFIETKIDLHNKRMLKEQLTEHLYAVIHQNELRKANKLQELTDKLDIHLEEEKNFHNQQLSYLTPDIPSSLHSLNHSDVQKFRNKINEAFKKK